MELFVFNGETKNRTAANSLFPYNHRNPLTHMCALQTSMEMISISSAH